jgi:hypothetical protein
MHTYKKYNEKTHIFEDPQMTCTHGSWNMTDLFF